MIWCVRETGSRFLPVPQIGTVQEITLNTVKIQNFDNTISTVPPYTLVSSPFQNWRGMKDSGGRRVMKNITLDLTTLQFWYAGDARPLSERDSTHGGLSAGGRSGAHQFTGLPGVYRAVSLQSAGGESGFGFDYQSERGYHVRSSYSGYFFSRNKVWKEYERIQSDIFDHLLAMVPKFDLKVYQYSD